MYGFTLSTPDCVSKKVQAQNHKALKPWAKEYDAFAVFHWGVNGWRYVGYFSGGKLVKP